MEQKTEVWEKFSFSDKKQKSSLDYLIEFKEGLVHQTLGELTIDIEAVDAYLDTDPPRLAAIYIFYIVAPKLGRFRRKILTVAEYSDTGRFPVDIVNHLDDNKLIISNEAEFKTNIERILTSPTVKTSIENLYQMSKEQSK